ncbi:polysaccharide deacetylase family protein [Halobacterium zhouii]|uniref:polysaccharide deacetylase family protein n=1 Tax=Halobacterium zhouii TaxID=2902624 RepID=UPI001E345A14|nr:polysaccharide deacetylase family protein [Halobacterium zhouii]
MSEFAVLLSHDVDRVRKTFQAPYYALRDRNPRHVLDLLPGRNPYWQFPTVMGLERDLGVRSAWYVLSERSLRELPFREWLRPASWPRYLGRYDVDDPAIVEVLSRLADGGWEVGLHGSYDSYDDPGLLAAEKREVEAALGRSVTGVRQHYLNLDAPETWRAQRDLGFRYDTSLGSSTEYGFRHGYEPFRPFDDDFVVFPLTAMECALPDPGEDYAAATDAVDDLLAEAEREDAVASFLWHPRYFSRDFPGYARLYRHLVEEALDRGAWVGPPGEYAERITDEESIAGAEAAP